LGFVTVLYPLFLTSGSRALRSLARPNYRDPPVLYEETLTKTGIIFALIKTSNGMTLSV
jgi:hypothetical protein